MPLSYRIDYTPHTPSAPMSVSAALRPMALTACFFAVFTLLVRAFWPEGWVLLGKLLLGEQGKSMVSCLEEIANSLGKGQSLRDAAVGAFRDVIHGH